MGGNRIAKQFCINGHVLTPENTGYQLIKNQYYPEGKQYPYCKQCRVNHRAKQRRIQKGYK